MTNDFRIDWSKWSVKHVPLSNDVDIHAPSKCLSLSCVNGCVGHTLSSDSVKPGFTSHVYSGTQRHGAMLQHVIDRAIATPRKPRSVKYVNPYKDLRKSSRNDTFRFKGMASTRFI